MTSHLAMIAEAVLAVYVMYCLSQFGVTSQLSQTYYLLGKKGWLFQAVLILVGVLVFPHWWSISTGLVAILVLVTVAGLIIIALNPDYENKQRKFHIGGAHLAATSTIAWMLLNGMWFNVVVAVCVFLALWVLTKKSPTYWGELVLLYTLLSTVS